MPGQDIHVVPADDRWAVETEGGHARETFDTQDEAIAAGTERAKQKQVELFIPWKLPVRTGTFRTNRVAPTYVTILITVYWMDADVITETPPPTTASRCLGALELNCRIRQLPLPLRPRAPAAGILRRQPSVAIELGIYQRRKPKPSEGKPTYGRCLTGSTRSLVQYDAPVQTAVGACPDDRQQSEIQSSQYVGIGSTRLGEVGACVCH
ncbi:DUF2188 domain-containing protein [Cupriavidus consociatus]|uniref:DUF2188 domain-containing protein n=1 Tax=Cupriavidus consociatus TaxID=2821357 RepID=UPI001AE14967|nr:MULTISPECIES: DUF2188 domain-containing protein [unclassified Cupriavidus]MBP0620911.1 DUF2188 domain-containing protein [Cupriavidus sp. LEh25]MDK2657577.1 DUF2188 domain-containing protein [Cupriavidus sp. LEh21]